MNKEEKEWNDDGEKKMKMLEKEKGTKEEKDDEIGGVGGEET